MISKIAFLYLSYFAWGCLVLLPVVKLQEVGQGFYRFIGLTCVSLQTIAVGVAISMGQAFEPVYRSAAWTLGLSLFFTLAFTIALRVRVRWFLWSCFGLAVFTGLWVILYYPWEGQRDHVGLALHAVSSALLLGSVTLAMLLGHNYLVITKLSITPLKRYSGTYILLTVWMALQVGWTFWRHAQAGPDGRLPEALMNEIIFVLFRSAWGLLAPLGLSYWIWETVKMKSTQSATGILYAAMICTMMGEGMGLYLTLRTGWLF